MTGVRSGPRSHGAEPMTPPSGPDRTYGTVTGACRRAARRLRAEYNRVLVVGALLVLLPTIVVVERLRRGTGRRLARWGVSVVAALCGVRFVVGGSRPIVPVGRAVVTPNHSSPMDIPALLFALPSIRFLAAADLFRIPLLASAMRALGTQPIDRRDHDRSQRQLDALVADRRAGDGFDLAIFPEGGIAPAGVRLPFKSGAFTLAIRTTSAIVPVAIHGTDAVLRPKGRLLVRPGVVTIEFLDGIATDGLTLDDRHVLRDHVQDLVTTALTERMVVPPLPTDPTTR